jgi:hypothetical protein
MEETTETTPNTVFTQDWQRNTVFPLPPTEVHQRDDGMVSICIGDCCGLVSSYHLVQPKELQLMAAYRKHHGSK